MNDELQDFVEAVQENRYGEYTLKEKLILVTNWEEHGDFEPTIIVEGEFETDSETVLEILETETPITCNGLGEQQGISINYYDVEGAELDID